MAKRRKVLPVSLNAEQRTQLERLWFYYGNYGPHSTPGNHNFIQRLLENGYDERPLHNSRTPKSQLPTAECVAAVEAVLALKRCPEENSNGGFRLVRENEERHRLPESQEMKETNSTLQ